jgi:frataxin-like iron-binding protein CyaY
LGRALPSLPQGDSAQEIGNNSVLTLDVSEFRAVFFNKNSPTKEWFVQ